MKPDCARYDAVIFDLFNTLIDINGLDSPHPKAWDYLGIPVQEWSRALFSDAEGRLRGHITEPEQVVRDIVGKLDPYIPLEKTGHAASLRVQQFHHALSHVLPHILTTLESLRTRGLALGLVSNADRIEASGWEGTEISRNFDSAVFSCDVGYVKPEPEIYAMATNKLGVEPERCLFVGDGGNDELAGARKVGMDTTFTVEFVAGREASQLQRARNQADFQISSISELLQ